MGKIQKLPESLIRLIAAGEVIERPASVLKELIENSLDAKATRIDIVIWEAGRTRLRVSDDGEGMTREDAELALDRHATSKLKAFDDLHALATFGFRGEALPSIAAVSRLELTTRTRHDPQGWRLRVEGGRLSDGTAVGGPPGTTLDVQDLFFNTPVREKFLKRDSTERTRLLKTVQEIAIAHPSVRWSLSFDGKMILELAATQELRERLSDLWGLPVVEKLIPLEFKQGPCAVHGFVNAIPGHHATKAFQLLYVNQRPVQQRMLTHAIYEAYHEWLPVGRHPVFVLFLDIDPALVDVNVHPTKREVRFSDERALYDLLFTKIRERFKEFASIPVMMGQPSSTAFSLRGQERREAPSSLQTDLVADADPALMTVESEGALPLSSKPKFLGQFQKLYLLIEQNDELLIVDQHAAAERVLFERLLDQSSTNVPPRQPLLSPVLWDVTPAQAETLRTYRDDFERLGFYLEPFGPKTFALKEWPVALPESRQAKRFLEEVIEALSVERPTDRTQIQHEIAARAACRAAVMANDSMSAPEVEKLLSDLSACERPMTCPHGRPTHIRLPLAELNRRFKRT
ncbi:MAG: DNA mismatch repair endonuclease MutL [Elusimicrobiota bacterium]|jgi:DNA mismatch repair protein MutL